MHCTNCGFVINESSRFCVNCGSEIISVPNNSEFSIPLPTNAVPNMTVPSIPESNMPIQNTQVGYSSKITDPAFNKYLSNTNKWAAMFSLFIAIVAVIGFYIAGENSSEMDNPESLFIGFGIGGMFLLIAFFQILGKKRSKTWDGQVVDKRVEVKKKKVNYGDDYSWQKYTLYTVVIQSTAGKRHEIRVEDDTTVYNYYHIGDHVRHHKGLNTYEKYDKTGDSIIFCNACASLNPIQEDYCHRCKCPLLK